jgi:hypothetical protein
MPLSGNFSLRKFKYFLTTTLPQNYKGFENIMKENISKELQEPNIKFIHSFQNISTCHNFYLVYRKIN